MIDASLASRPSHLRASKARRTRRCHAPTQNKLPFLSPPSARRNSLPRSPEEKKLLPPTLPSAEASISFSTFLSIFSRIRRGKNTDQPPRGWVVDRRRESTQLTALGFRDGVQLAAAASRREQDADVEAAEPRQHTGRRSVRAGQDQGEPSGTRRREKTVQEREADGRGTRR